MPHVHVPRRAAARVGTVLAVALALVGALAAPASGDAVAQPPSPGVIGPYPAPGEAVPAGRLEIAAFLVANAGVHNAEVYLDGARVAAERTGSATYQRVAAVVDVAAGQHTAEIRLIDQNGATTSRGWRFWAAAVSVGRLAGPGRVETSVAISRGLYPSGGAAAAVLARAEDFPDALAGAPLATAVGGPLLLTSSTALSEATATELGRILAPGATVHLLGGSGALSQQVADDVRGLGFVPDRIAGTDRYGTAAAVAERLPDATAAFLASGTTFADALAASAPAALRGMPILLTTRDALPDATRDHLAARGYEQVHVVGGTAVVADPVAADADARSGTVQRHAGTGRYETAAAVAAAFYADPAQVAVASGERFPDALSGGPHAAALGAPLLLSPGAGLARAQAEQLAAWQPSSAVLYGGTAVLGDVVAGGVRAATFDAGGPRETELAPAPGQVVNTLDTLQLTFDRSLRLDVSTVFVTLDGHEVYGSIAQGDFDNSIVFRAGALPIAATPNRPYPLRVVAAAYDGAGWRHLDYQLTYVKLDLSRGDSGPQVREVQQRLASLGYWLGPIDGTFGSLMTQAVYAFQKAEGLPRTGSVDAATRDRLAVAGRPQPREVRSGHYVEIDLTRQILLIIDDGVVTYTFNTSTGHGRYYDEDGHSGYAITPEGRFTFFREIDGMREADLGQMWRPKYFTDRGHAIHGSTSVPPYPASHGCARLTYAAIDFIWEAGLVPIGTRLLVYS